LYLAEIYRCSAQTIDDKNMSDFSLIILLEKLFTIDVLFLGVWGDQLSTDKEDLGGCVCLSCFIGLKNRRLKMMVERN
jgi:hypothetical protein